METLEDLATDTTTTTENTCSIYIGNVPWKATNEEIAELISAKANIRVKDVRIVKEKGTGRSRGFAFADIYHDNPEQFIKTAPELSLAGRILTVKYANDRKADQLTPNATIYTQNIES